MGRGTGRCVIHEVRTNNKVYADYHLESETQLPLEGFRDTIPGRKGKEDCLPCLPRPSEVSPVH